MHSFRNMLYNYNGKQLTFIELIRILIKEELNNNSIPTKVVGTWYPSNRSKDVLEQ